ncbi:MAG: nucleotidyltransferase domain-containing protein [bacterium]
MVKSEHNIKAFKIENDTIINNIITKYLNELKKRNINVASAYLFGSYAKGNATEWSDIDLAIIVNKFIGDEFDFQTLLNKIIVEIKLYDIEAHPFLEKEFDRTNPFVLEILKTGKKIL